MARWYGIPAKPWKSSRPSSIWWPGVQQAAPPREFWQTCGISLAHILFMMWLYSCLCLKRHAYVCKCICVYIYIYTHIYIYIYTHTHIYIYIYIHIYIEITFPSNSHHLDRRQCLSAPCGVPRNCRWSRCVEDRKEDREWITHDQRSWEQSLDGRKNGWWSNWSRNLRIMYGGKWIM